MLTRVEVARLPSERAFAHCWQFRLVQEGRVLGGLGVGRKQPGDFSPEVVDLLQTFAAQSTLAIQNARLFREIEQKSHELESRASTSRNSWPT